MGFKDSSVVKTFLKILLFRASADQWFTVVDVPGDQPTALPEPRTAVRVFDGSSIVDGQQYDSNVRDGPRSVLERSRSARRRRERIKTFRTAAAAFCSASDVARVGRGSSSLLSSSSSLIDRSLISRDKDSTIIDFVRSHTTKTSGDWRRMTIFFAQSSASGDELRLFHQTFFLIHCCIERLYYENETERRTRRRNLLTSDRDVF